MQVQYKINAPHYVRKVLHLTSQEWSSPLDKAGEVNPPQQEAPLSLRWGHPLGSPVAVWPTVPLSLAWEGTLRVWGHFNTAHVISLEELDLMILELNGFPLADSPRLPSLEQLRAGPYQADNTLEAPERTYWYALTLPLDSPFTDFAYQSLVNGNAIECYASLADPSVGLHKVVGMPFVLDSVTLYYAR